jgi:hypothetical protein
MLATTIGILVLLAHTRNDNTERSRGEGAEEQRSRAEESNRRVGAVFRGAARGASDMPTRSNKNMLRAVEARVEALRAVEVEVACS